MNALICLHPGFEEIEAVVPIDLLSRAGIEVTQAAAGDARTVTGRSGVSLQSDCLLDTCSEQLFDLVILPGGPGINGLRNNSSICDLLSNHANAGKLVGCICAAPLLLKDAGLHSGRKLVCHPSAEAELGVDSTEPVIVDLPFITSRGAGTAIAFALALIEQLTSREKADEIAASICWNHRD